MWNFSGTVNHSKPSWGSLPSIFQQHRNFCIGISNVSIVSEKCFKNPNFVNKHDLQFHHQPTAKGSSPSKYKCHNQANCDGSETSLILNPEDYSGNSCQSKSSIIHMMAGKKYNTVQDPKLNSEDRWSGICDIEQNSNKNRKHCQKTHKKARNKHSKLNIQDIKEMMEIDCDSEIQADISINIMNTNFTLEATNLSDYIVNCNKELSPLEASDHNKELLRITSCSPPKITCFRRERQYSIAESEDSFIVFDGESDQESELASLYNSDSESELEDDSNSSLAVTSCKKVRFAQKPELCEIHPMIQWSYAYRSARKGPWEEYARDRDRFNKRIAAVGNILAPILDFEHRKSIFKQRYENTTKMCLNSECI